MITLACLCKMPLKLAGLVAVIALGAVIVGRKVPTRYLWIYALGFALGVISVVILYYKP